MNYRQQMGYGQELSRVVYVPYNVKPSDTLQSIAKRYNVPPAKLAEFNNLEENFVAPNTRILVPRPAPEGYLYYTVKPGDNLYTIGQKYSLTPEELMRINKLENTMIYPNQYLLIPEDVLETTSVITYVVEPGEDLITIARKLNINPKDLLLLNRDLIKPGMTINIPKP